MKLKADEEFKSIIPALTTSEYQEMERRIKEEGCRDAVAVWRGIIVDGYNQFEICRKWNIPFRTEKKKFATRNEAIAWICYHQISHRNLTREAVRYLIGKRYEAEKAILKEEKRKNQYKKRDPDEHYGDIERKKLTTAERLGLELNMSHSTIEQYGKYCRWLDRIEKKCTGTRSDYLSGRLNISHKNIYKLSNMPASDVKDIIKTIRARQPGFGSAAMKVTDATIAGMNGDSNGVTAEPLMPKIKEMPKYNPDSELNGLMFTIPTWIEMINRLKGFRVQMASAEAKLSMYETLTNLEMAMDNLRKEMSRHVDGGIE